ncbi:MAG: hypothetical protein KGJ41_12890 [Rhodospirillales bacterium]|nr:hypothetical protein [Rhodospirillales bacterium]MDE2576161.1 hypothetical protein [Rhodospirillales bacterium]
MRRVRAGRMVLRVLALGGLTLGELALGGLMGPARAQTAAPPAPALSMPAVPGAPSPRPPHRRPAHKRLTAKQRFARANTTHDGHLTREQAQAGRMRAVVSHFDAIDRGHKGYVTEADLRAYAKARRLARRAARVAPKS